MIKRNKYQIIEINKNQESPQVIIKYEKYLLEKISSVLLLILLNNISLLFSMLFKL
jgi:hypothetical protein